MNLSPNYMTRMDGNPTRQKGAALIIGLVLLISMTIIGVGVLSTTSLEQRMAGNMTEMNLAFNAGDSGCQVLTQQIANIAGEPDLLCQRIGENISRCNQDLDENWWDDANDKWWSTNAIDLGDNLLDEASGRAVTGVSQQPQVVIQVIPNSKVVMGYDNRANSPITNFSIVCRGTGSSTQTESILEQNVIMQ